MKKRLVILFLLIGQMILAQEVADYQRLEKKIDSLIMQIDSLRKENIALMKMMDIDLSLKNRYKLYKTENIYNLLELDTKTGIIKQVQWGLGDTYEGWVYVNSLDLSFASGYGSNSFELYPTGNMYQFLLIDKTDGRKWHVQWGIEESKRWIRRIY